MIRRLPLRDQRKHLQLHILLCACGRAWCVCGLAECDLLRQFAERLVIKRAVFQLPNISRPVIAENRVHIRARQARGVLAHKGTEQNGDILSALAQRRERDGNGVEPVIEVAAEVSLLYSLE